MSPTVVRSLFRLMMQDYRSGIGWRNTEVESVAEEALTASRDQSVSKSRRVTYFFNTPVKKSSPIASQRLLSQKIVYSAYGRCCMNRSIYINVFSLWNRAKKSFLRIFKCIDRLKALSSRAGIMQQRRAYAHFCQPDLGHNLHAFTLKQKRKFRIARILEFLSSVCAVAGGSLLASNTEFSKYGFIILALSSSQMLIASILNWQKSLIVYAGSVFCFVDCLGVLRWILQ